LRGFKIHKLINLIKIRITILTLLFLFLYSCWNTAKKEKFDSQQWKSGNQIERGNMSTDLVESKILIGKTKVEILNILGQPEDSSKTNFHYVVDFGYMTPFHLDIHFDQTNEKANKITLAD